MTIERVASTMVALAATCCTADATPPNLIVNGSFEDPVLTSGFSVFPSIPGWTGGEGGIEIQADRVGGFTARGVADGEQFVELDTLDENSLMFQDVPTQANSTYVLSLAFAPRQLAVRPRNSNNVKVLWEGSQVALLGGPSAPGDFRLENWLTYSYELTAQSATGSSRLQFQALGPADGKGGLIDRVSLVRTPEPMAIVLLVLGVFAGGYRLRTTQLA